MNEIKVANAKNLRERREYFGDKSTSPPASFVAV
jgi:hypothetical protein